jgi:hypothetical protein
LVSHTSNSKKCPRLIVSERASKKYKEKANIKPPKKRVMQPNIYMGVDCK